MARFSLTSGQTIADAPTATTAGITPTANRLVLAFVTNAPTAGLANVPTAQGNGLAWQQHTTVANAQNDRRLTCFRAMGAAPSPGAITFSFGGQVQDLVAWSVFEYDNVDVSGANGAGAIAQSITGGTADGSSLIVTLGPFGNPANVIAAAVALANNRAVTPAPGMTEIHELLLDQPAGRDAALQSEERIGNAPVGWSWTGLTTAMAIALEIKTVVPVPPPPPPQESIEELARRFEPILYFHPAERFFPSDAKRYVEQSALWKAEIIPPNFTFDSKQNWGGIGQPFDRQPMIAHGKIAAVAGQGDTPLKDPPNLVETRIERHFFELGAWKDKANAAQPGVTATSQNTYANRDTIKARYESDLEPSRYWYHVEFFDTARLKTLAVPDDLSVPVASAVFQSLQPRNPALLCYYFLFPAHEQSLAVSCTNIEAQEFACFGGEWACVTVLLERESTTTPYRATHVGFTGRRPMGEVSVQDDFGRLAMKIGAWEQVQTIGDHPKFFVSRGTHSLYLEPGLSGVHDVEDDTGGSIGCGRNELYEPPAVAKTTTGDSLKNFGLELVKFLAGTSLGWNVGLAGIGGAAGILWTALEVDDNASSGSPAYDAAAPDEGPYSGNLGTVIHPSNVAIGDAGATLQPWRAAQNVAANGRTYNFIVDRTTQIWWPGDDGNSGYRGAWGPFVETDPFERRSGMRFPRFWLMFLRVLGKSKAVPGA